MTGAPALPLAGKRGLVSGLANEDSIAWGGARAFRMLGAEVAVTYLNDKARAYVEPLARQIDAPSDDLHGRVTDCSREGFLRAMDVSCWSFIRMAKLAELGPQGIYGYTQSPRVPSRPARRRESGISTMWAKPPRGWLPMRRGASRDRHFISMVGITSLTERVPGACPGLGRRGGTDPETMPFSVPVISMTGY